MLIGHEHLGKVMKNLTKNTHKAIKSGPNPSAIGARKKEKEVVSRGKFLKYKARMNGAEDAPSNLMNEALLSRLSKMLSKKSAEETKTREFSRIDEFLLRASLEQKAKASSKPKVARLDTDRLE